MKKLGKSKLGSSEDSVWNFISEQAAWRQSGSRCAF